MGDGERGVDDGDWYVLASCVRDIPAVPPSAADTLRQRLIGKGVFRSTSAIVSPLFEDRIKNVSGLCLSSESILVGNFRCLRCCDNFRFLSKFLVHSIRKKTPLQDEVGMDG